LLRGAGGDKKEEEADRHGTNLREEGGCQARCTRKDDGKRQGSQDRVTTTISKEKTRGKCESNLGTEKSPRVGNRLEKGPRNRRMVSTPVGEIDPVQPKGEANGGSVGGTCASRFGEGQKGGIGPFVLRAITRVGYRRADLGKKGM